MTELAGFPLSGPSEATGINDVGAVTGTVYLEGLGHAFLWADGKGVRDLGVLPGKRGSYALGINNRGDVVGYSQ